MVWAFSKIYSHRWAAALALVLVSLLVPDAKCGWTNPKR